MNELITIRTNENGQAVSARDLHEVLGIQKDFTDWFKYQAEKLGLETHKDFSPILGSKTEGSGGHNKIDFIIPLDTAKHLAMISGGEKAHTIREYFIQCEKAWNSPDAIMSRALQFANAKMQNLISDIEVMKPKAEKYNQFLSGENLQDMNTVAKVLGWGRNKLFAHLRKKELLMKNNNPYQDYIDRGYFEVKEKPIDMRGKTINVHQTFVTPKGFDYISKLVKA